MRIWTEPALGTLGTEADFFVCSIVLLSGIMQYGPLIGII
jgi:hypothetical protein